MEAKSNEHASRFRTMSPLDYKFTLVASDQLRGEYDYESHEMGFLSLREGETSEGWKGWNSNRIVVGRYTNNYSAYEE